METFYHQQSSTDDSKDTVQAMENEIKAVAETQIFFKTLFLNAEVQMSFVAMLYWFAECVLLDPRDRSGK